MCQKRTKILCEKPKSFPEIESLPETETPVYEKEESKKKKRKKKSSLFAGLNPSVVKEALTHSGKSSVKKRRKLSEDSVAVKKRLSFNSDYIDNLSNEVTPKEVLNGSIGNGMENNWSSPINIEDKKEKLVFTNILTTGKNNACPKQPKQSVVPSLLTTSKVSKKKNKKVKNKNLCQTNQIINLGKKRKSLLSDFLDSL
jgi:hypothetical protein